MKKSTNNKQNLKNTNTGVKFYNQIGYTFILCGIVSFFILGFISLLPQDYEKYNIPLFFGVWVAISLILIIIGILPILLGKYCKKYQIWIEKEVKSFHNKF